MLLRPVCLAVFASWISLPGFAADSQVTRENFVRAETDRMFRDIAGLAGGVNTFHHIRVPTPLDQQTVIRMNLDTLYSGAIIDTTDGATITVPKKGPMADTPRCC